MLLKSLVIFCVFISSVSLIACLSEDDLDSPDTDGDSPVTDGDEPDGDEPDGDEPDGDEPDGDEPDGDEPDGDEPDGDEPDGDGEDVNIRRCMNGFSASGGASFSSDYKLIFRMAPAAMNIKASNSGYRLNGGISIQNNQ